MRSPRPAATDLVALGWDDGWQAALDATPPPTADQPLRVGRASRVDRGLVTVLTGTGPVRTGLGADLLDAVARDRAAAPVTGDWVLLREWCDRRTTLETVLPRRTTLARATPSRRSDNQLLGANVTVAAVVVGLVPDPGMARIERLLAVAWGSGAKPLLVLTKADLVTDADELAAELRVEAPGVRVLVCSSVTGDGVDRLRAEVGSAGTLALLGFSGSGKSSLVNALVGAAVLAVRPIRADGRGRHTSVRRELVLLPGGGSVMDTPGVRGVGVAAGSSGADGLARVFADVETLAAGCRFADCAHELEPGCAVVAAVRDGRLAPRRLEAWLRLRRERTGRQDRADARTRGRRDRTGGPEPAGRHRGPYWT